MESTVGLVAALALGLAGIRVLRVWLPRTPLAALIASRGQSGRANGRLLRFGEARLASAAPDPSSVIPFPRSGTMLPFLENYPAPSSEGAEPPPEDGAYIAAPSVVRIDSPRDARPFADVTVGELWLRLSDFDTWPGRRERREALVEAIAAQPEWDDRAVYAAGVALALWNDNGAYGLNRARNRKRVQRLRAVATTGVVHLGQVRERRSVRGPAAGDRDTTAA